MTAPKPRENLSPEEDLFILLTNLLCVHCFDVLSELVEDEWTEAELDLLFPDKDI